MKTGLIIVFLTSVVITSFGQFSPSPEYISSNKGKWSIETPEVQELVHIIIAITPIGKDDENMVHHKTAYYKKVIAHFGPFENHEVVKEINQLLKKGNYARVKMDACGFYFDYMNKILKDQTYGQLNWSNKNYVEPLMLQLEDFSNKSGFRKFYRSNLNYYEEQASQLKAQMPIDQQWKWLEARFPNRYDNYRITFSPLVYGSHSTNRFETKDFKQTVMFICGPVIGSGMSEKVKEGLMTRVVFTEIDHNYVNPISDQYAKEIDKAFSDRKKWTSEKDSQHYGSAYAVFNEYMTWSVFNLYAHDTYDADDFETINGRVEKQMVNSRGFSRFKEFNQKLIELYKSKEANQSVVDLYPKILEWCKEFK